jgi:hypothetical protein
MEIKKQIKDIVDIQEKYEEAKKDILSKCKKLEKTLNKEILQRLRDAFPGVIFRAEDLLICTNTGCLTNRWKAEVYLESIDSYLFSDNGFWYEQDFGSFTKVKPPVPMGQLRKCLSAIGEDFGIKFKLLRNQPYSSNIEIDTDRQQNRW